MLRKKLNTLTTVSQLPGPSILIIDGKLKEINDHINGYIILLELKNYEAKHKISFGIMNSSNVGTDEMTFLITRKADVAAKILKEKFSNNPGVESLNIAEQPGFVLQNNLMS
jgi:hypothetical protein